MNKKIRIVVADDHPLFRAGVTNFLKDSGYEIAGEAGNGEEALLITEKTKPDILIVDMDMPLLNGIQVIVKLKKTSPNTKAVLLTMYKEEKIFNKVMDEGVWGYLLKESAVMEIINCIETVMNEEYFISPVLSSFLMKRMKNKRSLESEKSGLGQLTEMESKILKLISQSLSSKEIAQELFISPRTVDKHRENICAKLDIHGSMNLVKFALDNKQSL